MLGKKLEQMKEMIDNHVSMQKIHMDDE